MSSVNSACVGANTTKPRKPLAVGIRTPPVSQGDDYLSLAPFVTPGQSDVHVHISVYRARSQLPDMVNLLICKVLEHMCLLASHCTSSSTTRVANLLDQLTLFISSPAPSNVNETSHQVAPATGKAGTCHFCPSFVGFWAAKL